MPRCYAEKTKNTRKKKDIYRSKPFLVKCLKTVPPKTGTVNTVIYGSPIALEMRRHGKSLLARCVKKHFVKRPDSRASRVLGICACPSASSVNANHVFCWMPSLVLLAQRAGTRPFFCIPLPSRPLIVPYPFQRWLHQSSVSVCNSLQEEGQTNTCQGREAAMRRCLRCLPSICAGSRSRLHLWTAHWPDSSRTVRLGAW